MRLQRDCHSTLRWLILFSLDHTVNWEAVSAIGQIVGALAVVVSLLYLAREIRTNASAARLASVSAFNRWLGQLATVPHLAEVWNRGVRDFESLGAAGDRERFLAVILQLFQIFEEMYYNHLERHMDPRLWNEVETRMRALINGSPGIRAWWRLYSDWFSGEFANYVNQLTADSQVSKINDLTNR